MEKRTRNRAAHHNLKLYILKHKPSSNEISTVSITYTYKKVRKRRDSPIQIPMVAFDNNKRIIKKSHISKLKIQADWIDKFYSLKNDLELQMAEGIIDYNYAFRVLNNDYQSGVIQDLYRDFANDQYVEASVQDNVMRHLESIQNHFKTLGHLQYSRLNYSHFQKPADRKKIELIILREIKSINSETRKKYFNYLNKMASVVPYFKDVEQTPFKIRLKHTAKPPKMALDPLELKRGILGIKDNLYFLEAYLWWLYSFCLRGLDTCDLVCLDESMLTGDKGGDLREFYAWERHFDKEAERKKITQQQGTKLETGEWIDFPKDEAKIKKKIKDLDNWVLNDEKFYVVGKRVKEMGKHDNRTVVKVLYNQTPVLLIHKMLKHVISILHPDLAYKGSDKVKLYNINYHTKEGKRIWKNRRGTMSVGCKKLFGATLKQARHTFSTVLAGIQTVDIKEAEKQLSTSLGHANNKTQKYYVNPDQDKMDILQIEAVERFGIRDVVKSLIQVCSSYRVKDSDGIESPMLDAALVGFSPLELKSSFWDWSKEVRYNQLKQQQKSQIDLVVDKDGNWIEKSIIKKNPELVKLEKERAKSHLDDFLKWDI